MVRCIKRAIKCSAQEPLVYGIFWELASAVRVLHAPEGFPGGNQSSHVVLLGLRGSLHELLDGRLPHAKWPLKLIYEGCRLGSSASVVGVCDVVRDGMGLALGAGENSTQHHSGWHLLVEG